MAPKQFRLDIQPRKTGFFKSLLYLLFTCTFGQKKSDCFVKLKAVHLIVPIPYFSYANANTVRTIPKTD
jgi:hypothetical protein